MKLIESEQSMAPEIADPDTSSGRGDELKRALVAIRDLRARLSRAEGRALEPIAIVGLSCRFPGSANSPDAFWKLLVDEVEPIRPIPADRWDIDALYDSDPDARGKMYVREGGFLDEPIDVFDAGFFGIPPREAAHVDPSQRMLLELAWEAVESAGIAPPSLEDSRTGVWVGLTGSDYYVRMIRGSRIQDVGPYWGGAAANSIGAGRISHFLGLRGPSVALDTACSSSLVAIVEAVDSIRSNRCDQALVGGVSLMLSPEATMVMCKLRALSPSARCRTFDAKADGYLRSEGGGMVFLKRLSDARRDGDPILAVVRGGAVNHDGRSSGLTVPNAAAQKAVIQTALANAGLGAGDIGYIEAHGTATPLGDPIELRALTDTFRGVRTIDDPVLLGSVKTNVGHMEVASGMAALIKVVQSMRHRRLPRHLHFETPTPHVDWDHMPLKVVDRAMDWPERGGTRIAGLSGFGVSGTNAHVIVEEAPGDARSEPDPPERPVRLVCVSGRSESVVRELAEAYGSSLRSNEVSPEDLEATTTTGRAHFGHRAVAVGRSREELASALGQISAGVSTPDQVRGDGAGRSAFLFTGQGSQYPGMGIDLYRSSSVFREALDECDRVLEPVLGTRLVPLIEDRDGSGKIHQTAYTQPALFAIEWALGRLWNSWGVRPAFVMGHSLGEYVAATFAGVMDLEHALDLVATRGRLMQEQPAGGRMAVVFATEATVSEMLSTQGGTVSIAAINGPENMVISGSGEDVGVALSELSERGVSHRELEVSHAFHSALMDPILDRFEAAVSEVPLRKPVVGLVSNVNAQLLSLEEAVDPGHWRRHVRMPVRFAESIATLVEKGVRTFVEVGPHPSLLGMARGCVDRDDIHWIPSLRRDGDPWGHLTSSVGALYRAGHEIDWGGFEHSGGGRRISIRTYPFERARYWFDEHATKQSNDETDGESVSGVRARHPLLGVRLDTPAVRGWVFQKRLAPWDPVYLRDHEVEGRVIVPGAVYVEMALAAAQEGPKWPQSHLLDMRVLRPLVLPDDAPVTCQVIVDELDDSEASVRIMSRVRDSDGGSRWVIHATGRLAAGSGAAAVTPDASELERLRESATTPIDLSSLREALIRSGIRHGPEFERIEEAWIGDEGVVGRVRAAGAVQGMHRVDPIVLDCGLQLLRAYGLENEGGNERTLLLAGFGEIAVAGTLGTDVWVYVSHPRLIDDEDGAFHADLTYTDADGNLVIVRDFEARPIRDAVGIDGIERDCDQAGPDVYRMNWSTAPPLANSLELTGDWVVIGDAETAIALAGAVGDNGHVTSATFEGERHWTEAIGRTVAEWGGRGSADDSPLRVVLATSDDRSHDDPVEGSIETAKVLLNVLKTLTNSEADIQLILVSRGVANVDGAPARTGIAGAAFWGMLGAIQSEHPELGCRLIDLDPDGSDIDLLLAELATVNSESIVVHRSGSRKYPRLRRWNTEIDAENHRPVESEAPFVIDVEERGRIDSLRYVPTALEEPGTGEIEVEIHATGLNFRDVLNVLGMYPGDPGAPGTEFAGVIARVGPDVDGLAAGDRVMGTGLATFSSHVRVPRTSVARIPDGLDPTSAATIPVVFATADWALRELARLRPGERVLIHSGAGGVGLAAIQIARSIGAEVYATAGSHRKREFVRRQGVEFVYDSRDPGFADELLRDPDGEGVHVVLNSLTGEMLGRSLDLLRPGGRFIELGKAEVFDPAEVAHRHPGVAYRAWDLTELIRGEPEVFQKLLERLVGSLASGELRPLPVRAFHAESVVDAFRFMAQARHIGKISVFAPRRGSRAIREDGAYFVSGGAGGIGRELVSWLARRGAGLIVVNGRSEATPEIEEWLRGLRDSGARVEYVSGDISAPDAADWLRSHFDGLSLRLRGVFHAAGVLDDGLISGYDEDRLERVISPKVRGAWALHRATAHSNLDHFVLFSSVASFSAGPGQASYGAANAILDTMAGWRRSQGLAGLSIDWGGWEGAGMMSRLSARERALLEEKGLALLPTTTALARLSWLLEKDVDRAVVTRFAWPGILALGEVPAILSDAVPDDTHAPRIVEHTISRAELLELDPGERGAKILSYLQQVIGSVLGVSGEGLHPDSPMSDVGFDSLMVMEIRHKIESQLGVTLPANTLFAGPSPRRLTGIVSDQIGEGRPVVEEAPREVIEGEI